MNLLNNSSSLIAFPENHCKADCDEFASNS